MYPAKLPGALAHPKELEQFAEVKLIAFDLDGTLIGHPTAVPGDRVKKLLKLLHTASVRVTLATGRTFAGASQVVGSVDALRKIPLVLYNGSVVMESEGMSVIATTSIRVDAALSAAQMAACAGADTFVYCVHDQFERIGELERVYYLGNNTAPLREFNGMPVRIGWEPSDFEIPVALLISSPNESTLPALRVTLSTINGISVTQSSSRYIEVRPVGSSKESGIATLAKMERIDRKHILAVGDNDNDVELLKWVGIGVCVSNSSAAAKSASRYISDYGAEDGAIQVLDLIRRAQRLAKGGKRRGNST
jgi:Cof subfamily protein (haloacid dehalogenase superfamily)